MWTSNSCPKLGFERKLLFDLHPRSAMSEFVQLASSDVASSYLCSRKLEVTLSLLHVDGVITKELVNVGDVIYAEKPLCFLQTIPNAQDVIVCGGCQTVLGSLDVHVGILSKTVSREDITSPEGIIPCRAKCGVLYCSGTSK